MMLYTMPIGTMGELMIRRDVGAQLYYTVDVSIKVFDNSDFWNPEYFAYENLPWSYTIGPLTGNIYWKYKDLVESRSHQRLSPNQHGIYVGPQAEQFTLHIGATGTDEIGGPHTFTVPLDWDMPDPVRPPRAVGSGDIGVKLNGVWRRATVWVKVPDGGWQQAQDVAINVNGEWKSIKGGG